MNFDFMRSLRDQPYVNYPAEYQFVNFLKPDGTYRRKKWTVRFWDWYKSPEFLERNKLYTMGDFFRFINDLGYHSHIEGAPFHWDYISKTYKLPRGKTIEQLDQTPIIRFQQNPYNAGSSSGQYVLFNFSNPEVNYNSYYDGMDVDYSGCQFVCNYTNTPDQTVTTSDPIQAFKNRVPSWLTKMNNYSYKPTDMQFMCLKEHTNQYLGMEIEFSTMLSPLELQYIVMEVEPKQKPFFFFKSDSSVSGSYHWTMELVTFPCTRRYLRKEFKTFFSKLDRLVKENELDMSGIFDLERRDNNGIHIHVSKNSFSLNEEVIDRLWKNKFLTVWNNTDDNSRAFLDKLSRRVRSLSSHSYCAPSSFMAGKKLVHKLKEGTGRAGGNRYSSCHETANTLEVRVFRSIWDIEHILYCIDIVCAVQEYTAGASIRSVESRFAQTFIDWLDSTKMYPNAKKVVAQCV